jgi:hypothetical protein
VFLGLLCNVRATHRIAVNLSTHPRAVAFRTPERPSTLRRRALIRISNLLTNLDRICQSSMSSSTFKSPPSSHSAQTLTSQQLKMFSSPTDIPLSFSTSTKLGLPVHHLTSQDSWQSTMLRLQPQGARDPCSAPVMEWIKGGRSHSAIEQAMACTQAGMNEAGRHKKQRPRIDYKMALCPSLLAGR